MSYGSEDILPENSIVNRWSQKYTNRILLVALVLLFSIPACLISIEFGIAVALTMALPAVCVYAIDNVVITRICAYSIGTLGGVALWYLFNMEFPVRLPMLIIMLIIMIAGGNFLAIIGGGCAYGDKKEQEEAKRRVRTN